MVILSMSTSSSAGTFAVTRVVRVRRMSIEICISGDCSGEVAFFLVEVCTGRGKRKGRGGLYILANALRA